MSKRISHSVLDPWLATPIKGLYGHLPIPRGFPPEGIVVIGHICAVGGAVGFAFSSAFWWCGIVAAAGVILSHILDCIDGTHARATGQCRNGGELLDHFLDPLSFSYLLTGIALSCGRLDLGIAAVVLMYATAVLTSITAKMTGEFTLARFGPTEFKTLLVLFGAAMALASGGIVTVLEPEALAFWFLSALVGIGILQLVINLVQSVNQVNRGGAPPDTSEWE